jgi:hypothetical protein
MSEEVGPAIAEAELPESLRQESTYPASLPVRSPGFITRAVAFAVKLFWGMMFCQFLLGSLLVAGWTSRLAQRAALKRWWRASARRAEWGSFLEFLAESEWTAPQLHWPNWFLKQDWRKWLGREQAPAWIAYAVRVFRALFGSLWMNFRLGIQMVANTCVLILPAGLLWWFGWYDGWNNSFNKGYEQAVVGPVISIMGIFVFIGAMFYVPMAQARQAATGEWRSFYQFRLVWSVARSKWLSCVGLALGYCAAGLVLNILKTGPEFWPQGKPLMEGLGPALARKSLDSYFFWCALAMLPAFVILRLVGARIYASGLLRQVRTGAIEAEALGVLERAAIGRLRLLELERRPERHFLVRVAAWTGTRIGRAVCGIVLALIWFGFVAEIYVAEFLNYHGSMGWLNQPLIQTPWFHYLPSHIEGPGGNLFLVGLFLVIVWLTRRISKRFESRS